MNDVRARNNQFNGHWFDREAMEFFRTIIESELIAGRYFITSEQREDHTPRLFSVRMAEPSGAIETVGRFQGYASLEQARAAITALLAGPRLAVGDEVEAGETPKDLDRGRVVALEAGEATVAWQSGVRTTQPADLLRKVANQEKSDS